SLPVTSHRDEEWAGDAEASSDLTREVVPVDHGQPDVEQGDVGMDVVQSVQCGDAVMKDDHVVTRVLEQLTYRGSQVIVVVDDHHATGVSGERPGRGERGSRRSLWRPFEARKPDGEGASPSGTVARHGDRTPRHLGARPGEWQPTAP